MFYKKIGFRKKILFVLLLLVTGLFLIYLIADLYFIDKIKKVNAGIHNEYAEFLNKTLEADNLEKEEIFLKTIANYGVSILNDPKDDVINSQLELGKFLCSYYDYELLTKDGKAEIIEKYFISKNIANAYKNEKKHVFWGNENDNENLLHTSSDALFFTLDSLKILKQSNSSLIKSVFIKTSKNLCIAYPVNSVLSIQSDFERLTNNEDFDDNKTISYINKNGHLVLGTRFKSTSELKYDFMIAAIIDYKNLMKNICEYAWKRNVDAAALINEKGDVIFYRFKKNIPEMSKLAKIGMNLYDIKSENGETPPNIVELKNEDEGFFSFTLDNKETYVGFSTVPDLNWKFMFLASSNDIKSMLANIESKLKSENTLYLSSLEKQIFDVQWFLFIILTIVFIVFIVLSLSLSGKLSKSLAILHNGVEKIRNGDLSYKIPQLKTGDEIEKLIVGFNGMVDSINQYIKDLAETIQAKKEVEADIKIAADIQRSMLPQGIHIPDKANDIGLEIASTLVPSKTISGDFYDYFLIDDDNLFFAIGDVSGKGVPASLFMVTIKTLLKEYVLESKSSLKNILLHLNKSIARDNYSCTFVTLFCGILNLKSGKINYALAGHDMPVIYRFNEKIITDFGIFSSTILGAFKDNVKFVDGEVKLEVDDFLLLYTDGITESRNKENNLWGRKNLENTVKTYYRSSPDDLISEIKAKIMQFTNKPISEDDDFTILVLKRNK